MEILKSPRDMEWKSGEATVGYRLTLDRRREGVTGISKPFLKMGRRSHTTAMLQLGCPVHVEVLGDLRITQQTTGREKAREGYVDYNPQLCGFTSGYSTGDWWRRRWRNWRDIGHSKARRCASDDWKVSSFFLFLFLAFEQLPGADCHVFSNTDPCTTLSSNTGTIATSSLPITSSTSGTITTATASKTSSAPVTSGTKGIAANPYPGQNLTTIQRSDDSIFTLLCSVYWSNGEKSAHGDETVTDLSTPTTAYTLKECIADCINFNTAAPDESPCRGVVYTANLTAAFDGGQGGKCFLKNTISRYFPSSNTSMAAGILGGSIS